MSPNKTLIILGGGPKALAVAAMMKVYRQLGMANSNVIIIEKNIIGANWCGQFGYTNGKLQLGTAPEKDIGFPYSHPNSIVNELMQQFSWQTFLIEKKRFANWIDRNKPQPTHLLWANYLQWVADKLRDSTRFITGEIIKLDILQQHWFVTYVANQQSKTLQADAFMLTGPGEENINFPKPCHPNILSSKTFWHHRHHFTHKKIAVIGAGENAASVVSCLKDENIDLICKEGLIYSRGESYFENTIYSGSNELQWQNLTLMQRENMIKRTDRGVFSLAALREISNNEQINMLPGEVKKINVNEKNKIEIVVTNANFKTIKEYDYIILAMGFSQSHLLTKLMSARFIDKIKQQHHLTTFDDHSLQHVIGSHLQLESITPELFLPSLAGLTQGPGFANLSCLGLLATRIAEKFCYQSQWEKSCLLAVS